MVEKAKRCEHSIWFVIINSKCIGNVVKMYGSLALYVSLEYLVRNFPFFVFSVRTTRVVSREILNEILWLIEVQDYTVDCWLLIQKYFLQYTKNTKLGIIFIALRFFCLNLIGIHFLLRFVMLDVLILLRTAQYS